jgi:integrase
MTKRSDLRPTTRRLYKSLLNDHIYPKLGKTELGKLSTSSVRDWYSALSAEHPATATRAYQVLRAALNVAVLDGVLAVNPCKVRAAGQGHSEERPVATVAEAKLLADAVDPRWRTMVLLAYWCSLRLGELRGLQRRDLDPLHGWVTVRDQVVDVGGHLLPGPPKTEAGRRRVAIPHHIRDDIAAHLAAFVGPEKDAYVFTGPKGSGPLASATWRRTWGQARKATGLTEFRFHDLRHSGNTLAAATGASTRELMARMGHASPRAALIYQHATSDRDQAIAEALSDLAQKAEIHRLGGEGVATVAAR